MDKRVRTGCATCRKRRVKCDEKKPVCGRCQAANFVCEGYMLPRRASKTTALSTPTPKYVLPFEGTPNLELSWQPANWRREELPLYHHFVTTTVVRLFRTDHVSFWRDQVAEMSCSVDFVYEALLAVGAIHRASLIACQEGNGREAAKLRVLGFRSYGKVLRLLHSHLSQDTVTEMLAVLVVLVLLTFVECLLEKPKGAFHHLWAAIRLFQGSEHLLANTEGSNVVPVYDSMLNLDFLAQQLVPYASSSFLRPNVAMMVTPFWNRPSPKFSEISEPDCIATEYNHLLELLSGHNKLSRVFWGCWCPASERPSRAELMGFYSEMLLWKANSPATFASCDGLDAIKELDFTAVERLPIPPPALHFSSSRAAQAVAMYNSHLGSALEMISTTDQDPDARDLENFHLVYQNLCIAAELLEKHQQKSGSAQQTSNAISTGLSIMLYHGARRCFSMTWQKWAIAALRLNGGDGFYNGFTAANTLDIMILLENMMHDGTTEKLCNAGKAAYLGPIRDRIIPVLMPRGDDDEVLAFYLQYGHTELDGDQRVIQVVARITWKQDAAGIMTARKLDVYDSPLIAGDFRLPDWPQILELFYCWRQAVGNGWHGLLETGAQNGYVKLWKASRVPKMRNTHPTIEENIGNRDEI